MGFDVTYHPINPTEIISYLFDSLNDPTLIKQKIDEIIKIANIPAEEEENIKYLNMFYEELIQDLFKSNGTEHIQGEILTRACCTISSFLHPYWYCRGFALSFLIGDFGMANIFESIAPFATSDIKKRIRHNELIFAKNYSASGYANSNIARSIYDDTCLFLSKVKNEILAEKKAFYQANTPFVDKVKQRLGFSINHIQYPNQEKLETISFYADPDNEDN